MAAHVDLEALGDWSNIKGTRYHLVFAVWLILKRRATAVRFYDGNDLSVTPVRPPNEASATGTVSAVADATDSESQVWIQLKATRSEWTLTALLGDNLLFNFLCNAVRSERSRQRWSVWLVSESEVQRDEVLAFTNDPTSKPVINDRFRAVLRRVEDHFEAAGSPLSAGDAERLGFNVIRQIADSQVVHFATIKAEVETELALAFPERRAVARNAAVLIGGMLTTAGESAAVVAFDRNWLNRLLGAEVVSDLPFDVDVPSACDRAVRRATERFLRPQCVPRRRLMAELDAFLSAPDWAFALTGRSGVGKSWAVADWISTALAGKVCLYLAGADFRESPSLDSLAVRALTHLTGRDWPAGAVVRKLSAAAAVSGQGPFVVVLDDLKAGPFGAARDRALLKRFAEDIQDAGGKLVLTCQDTVWEQVGYSQEFGTAGWFRPRSREPSPQPESEDPSRTPESPLPSASETSFALGDFTRDEFEQAIRLRSDESEASHRVRALRHPAFAPLRRPFLLDTYLTSTATDAAPAARCPFPRSDRSLGGIVPNCRPSGRAV